MRPVGKRLRIDSMKPWMIATVILALLAVPAFSDTNLPAGVVADWLWQDTGTETATNDPSALQRLTEKVRSELGLSAIQPAADSNAALAQYTQACEQRRARRLANVPQRFVFAKHYNMGGSHYAYTEGQSDAQAERNFHPGAALCLWENGQVRTLLADAKGVIRNPDVSYDGRRILFSWKKDLHKDDYHLYEMDAASGQVRQLTDGGGVADYEGCYLPDGGIMFNSTRCVQTVDCWWTEVSNLYRCDADGRQLRRLTYDQVHDNYPTVTHDGRVLYTRWDYNDRGQLYPQPLFEMNPDGTSQTEFYGNNSWFPTTIIHARGLPGSRHVIAIATGHHSDQSGKLILIDPAKGRQENDGVQLIAPVRATKAERIDAYGQDGDQFQYPYPLSETDFLVTYAPKNPGRDGRKGFGIYWMDVDGHRELLVWDDAVSCNQPVPVVARSRPRLRPSTVDERKTTGTYYVQDVYAGPGLKDVPRGTIKSLRVVALDYRAAGVGNNGNGGPAGGALVSTPVAINNGTWDVKRVLGSVPVEADGSAYFTVPARTPVYFQLLDAKGYTVQSMRSWSTLQPGERASCVGCHESKNSVPPVTTYAQRNGPRELQPFYGPARGFSYAKEIQPIWDKHCVRCHTGEKDKPFSLLATPREDTKAKRFWTESYLNLTQHGKPNKFVNWLNVQSIPPMLPPYFAGAVKSDLLKQLEAGHHDVKLSREELEKIACWIDLLVPFCGDYTEANAWTDAEKAKYEHFRDKRERLATALAK
jgi:hypothetical protein